MMVLKYLFLLFSIHLTFNIADQGFYATTLKNPTYFGSIDVESGSIIPIVNFTSTLYSARFYFSIIDPSHDKYSWLMISSEKQGTTLVTIDIKKATYSISPAAWNVMHPLVMFWDPSGTKLYQAIYTEGSGAYRALLSIDATTWETKVLYNFGSSVTFISGTYNPKSQIFYSFVAPTGNAGSLSLITTSTLSGTSGIKNVTIDSSLSSAAILGYTVDLDHQDILASALLSNGCFSLVILDPLTGMIKPSSSPSYICGGFSVGAINAFYSTKHSAYVKQFVDSDTNDNWVMMVNRQGQLIKKFKVSEHLGSLGVL